MPTRDARDDGTAPAGLGPVLHRVRLHRRHQHLVEVSTELPPDLPAGTRVVLATWTPGSYVVRDHVRHLRRLSAVDGAGAPVVLEPDGVSAWRLGAFATPPVHVVAQFHADERTLRTTHADERHALLVGAATFLCVEPAREREQRVRFEDLGPGDGLVATLAPDGPAGFVADGYDALADAAFGIGDHVRAERELDGTTHRVVDATRAHASDVEALADDLVRLADRAAALLGRAPLDHGYTVLVVDGEPGGLEHRDGTTVCLPSDGGDGTRARAATLLAHEYLHLWNGRRMGPRELVRPVLDRPVPTRGLWVTEGWTSYYDLLLAARAGILPLDGLLDALARRIDHVRRLPGARVQSLRDASWTAWTKHYRRDADTPNTATDYYVHGAVVALELDLALRRERPAGDGLDDVLRLLWSRHADGPGFDEADVIAAIDDVGGPELARRAERAVGSPCVPDPLPMIGAVGLTARTVTTEHAELGVVLDPTSEAPRLLTVLEDGPAWRAGLVAGDLVRSVDGVAVDRADLPAAIGVGDLARALEVDRADRTRRVDLVPGPPATRLVLEADPDGSTARTRWLAPTTDARRLSRPTPDPR